MTASDLLAALQRQNTRPDILGSEYDKYTRELYLAEMTAEPDSAIREYLEQNHAKLESWEAKYSHRLPTRYQSIADYARLAEAKERLDKTLRGGGPYPPKDNLVFGSVEMVNLNALSTYCSDSDQYLIVFNRGLLAALLLVCNYVTFISKVITRPGGRLDMDRMFDDFNRGVEEIDAGYISQAAAPYRDLLAAVSTGRMPNPTDTISLPDPRTEEARWRNDKWTFMEDSIAHFVFAHEYMHILLGHLSGLEESSPSEHTGGWGNEYQADSDALELIVYTWMNEVKGNPKFITWLIQAVSTLFIFISQVERYTTEVMGESRMIWRDDKTHPPTWIRYIRLRSEISRRYPYLPWRSIEPHILNIEHGLEKLYEAAVGGDRVYSATSAEWWFQYNAFNSLYLGLFPQHMVVLAHCVKMALDTNQVPEDQRLEACLRSAARDLSAFNVRPLPNEIPSKLALAAKLICEHALRRDLPTLGSPTIHGFADRLISIAVHDALARYGSATDPP